MSFFYIIHFIICVLLILVVLMQDGKAGGLTSVADSSKAVFGAKGAGDFLSKVTTYLAVFFMVTSLSLAIFNKSFSKSIAEDYVPPTNNTQTVTPVPGTDGQAPQGDIQLPNGETVPLSDGAVLTPEVVPMDQVPEEILRDHQIDVERRKAAAQQGNQQKPEDKKEDPEKKDQ